MDLIVAKRARFLFTMLILFLLYFVILIIIIYIVDYLLCHASEASKLFNKIPGPKPIPLFGNILDFLGDPISLFYAGRSMSNRYKSIYRASVFGIRVVNLYDPCDIEVILTSQKHITKSFVYNFIRPWLNDGLLTSAGDKWQRRRKILTPTFHFNILRDFCTIFSEQCQQLIKQLEVKIGQDVDVFPHVTSFALDSICETAMGTDLNKVEEKKKIEYKNAIFDIGSFAVHRLVRAWLHPNFLFRLSSLGKRQERVLKVLHGFSTNVIRFRRSIIKYDDGGCGMNHKKRMAMLDLLLAAEKEGYIDESGIREEVDTFMFEGHDTTTMAITFCLMLFANHQKIQDLAYDEIKDLCREDAITIDILNQMKYLERCIKESLRLYPSVPMIGRVINEDVKLPKYKIPAGTTFHIQIFDLHRNPDIYPDPNKFDPDRFTNENCAKRHPFAYIPFSAGPRNCIGQRFAILELKTIISKILLNFKLEPITRPDDIIFTADLVLRSANPIKIKLSRRIN